MPCDRMQRPNWREYCVTCSRWTRFGCTLDSKERKKYVNNARISDRTGSTLEKFISAQTAIAQRRISYKGKVGDIDD